MRALLTTDLYDREQADRCRQEGLRLLRQLSGLRCENLEGAIKCFRFALKVYEHQGLHEDRAATLIDLAKVYEVRLCGNLSTRQEKAIQLYLEAQRVFARDKYRSEWAVIQFNLGNLYLRRITDSREDNHRRAKKRYLGALRAFSEERMPDHWAKVCNSLGIYYLEAVTGERADNLEKARSYLKRASTVFVGSDASLVDWARVQNNLGTVWRYRIRGSRADNLEQSIRCYESALRVLDRDEHQYLWADVHHNLGISYAERVKGVRTDNLKKSREHLNVALQLRNSAGLIVEAARTQYQMQVWGLTGQMGNQAEQIERAIRDLERIKQNLAQHAHPIERARMDLGLGNAYLMRVRSDRVTNIETAIKHFEAALEVITVQNAPAEWSYIQNGLAAAYRERLVYERRVEEVEEGKIADEAIYQERPSRERLANFDKAINGLQAGLGTLLDKGWHSEWAKMQNNLAGAYWDRGRYCRNMSAQDSEADEDFRRAIDHAKEALTVYSLQDYPVEWALSNYIIGNALSDLTTVEDRPRRWRQAIEHFQSALKVFTDPAYPLQRAWALNDYGVTLLSLDREAPLSQRELQDAIRLFREAIQTHKGSGLRTEVLRSIINLGALYHAMGRWSKAYAELGRAVAIIETLRADALGEPGRVHIAEQYTRAYQYLVDTCVRRGKRFWKKALERVEASKGRAFLAEIGTDDYPVPANLSADFREKESVLLKSLRDTEIGLRHLETSSLELEEGEKKERRKRRNELLRQQARKTAKYDDLLKRIEAQAPGYVALRRGDAVAYATLQSLLNHEEKKIGVVLLFAVQERFLAFVMRSGCRGPEVIPIALDEETLRTTYWNSFKPVLRGRRTQSWMGDLGDRLFSQVLSHLVDVDLVYLVPTGFLYAMPLHVLPVNGQRLVECFPVAYAPSLAVLSRVTERARHRSPGDRNNTLVVGNPSGWPELASLENAEAVAREVAGRFGVTPILRGAATKQEVLDRLPAARVVFFACHGRFNQQTFLDSGLYLTRTSSKDELEDILTVREIMEKPLSVDLVVLSACQTGLSHGQRGDELTGLARAFLQAGASTVVVALWSVSEASAAELMRGFFSRLYPDGEKVTQAAMAMHESCLDLLRNEYPDFFDWGPFIVIGDWK